MTAEGDNSVLMQKTTKELLQGIKKENVAKHKALGMAPHIVKRMVSGTAGGDVRSSSWLLNLFSVREDATLNELASRLHAHKSNGVDLFSSWSLMEQVNSSLLNMKCCLYPHVSVYIFIPRI